jgi:hypothetical protein
MAKRWWLLASLAVMLTPWAAAAADGLRVSSPLEYQVFQRQTRDAGTIRVQGEAQPGVRRVEYRVAGADAWTAIEVGEKGAFSADVATPAGGWYAIEVRRSGGGEAVRVEHVGIGEVFVVAGQSNSTNYGTQKQKPASGFVVAFDGERWAIADDPQPGTHDKSKNGSFVPAFGDALYAQLHVPIAVASTGHGATSVRQWLPKGERMANEPTISKWVKPAGPGKWEATGELFDHFMRRAEALGPHGFRAVLWHQGESDAGQARAGYPAERQITGTQYTAFLETLIRASRKRAGWDVPWFVARATYHSEADPADEEFRAAQLRVCEDGLALAGPDTDSLRKDLRAGVHFNAQGQVEHGKLWARCVGDWVERQK